MREEGRSSLEWRIFFPAVCVRDPSAGSGCTLSARRRFNFLIIIVTLLDRRNGYLLVASPKTRERPSARIKANEHPRVPTQSNQYPLFYSRRSDRIALARKSAPLINSHLLYTTSSLVFFLIDNHFVKLIFVQKMFLIFSLFVKLKFEKVIEQNQVLKSSLFFFCCN